MRDRALTGCFRQTELLQAWWELATWQLFHQNKWVVSARLSGYQVSQVFPLSWWQRLQHRPLGYAANNAYALRLISTCSLRWWTKWIYPERKPGVISECVNCVGLHEQMPWSRCIYVFLVVSLIWPDLFTGSACQSVDYTFTENKWQPQYLTLSKWFWWSRCYLGKKKTTSQGAVVKGSKTTKVFNRLSTPKVQCSAPEHQYWIVLWLVPVPWPSGTIWCFYWGPWDVCSWRGYSSGERILHSLAIQRN